MIKIQHKENDKILYAIQYVPPNIVLLREEMELLYSPMNVGGFTRNVSTNECVFRYRKDFDAGYYFSNIVLQPWDWVVLDPCREHPILVFSDESDIWKYHRIVEEP